jgi:hypothetical protein
MVSAHRKSILTWAAVLLVALVGVAEATWQTAGQGEATGGTAGSNGLDDQFTVSWDPQSNGYKAQLAIKFKCTPCPRCVSPNLPQVSFQYTINYYVGTTYLGSTQSGGTQHQCQCPTTLISVTSGTLVSAPTTAQLSPTVICSCCNGSTPVWTQEQEDLMNNLVPGLIELTAAE